MLTILILCSCHTKDTGEEPEPVLYPPMGLVFTLSAGVHSEVSFLDLTNMRIIRTLPLSTYMVQASVVDFNGDRLVVADGRSEQVIVHELPGLATWHIATLGGEPVDVETDVSAGRIYVVTHNGNFGVDSVGVSRVDTMAVALHPRRLTLRPPDRKEAWIVSSDAQMIQIAGLMHWQMLDTMVFTSPPTDVQFSPDGLKAYVALTGAEAGVTAYSTLNHQIVGHYPGGQGPYDLAVTTDGRYLAASDSSLGKVHIWDVEGNASWSIDVSSRVGSICFAQRTHTLYALACGSNQVKRIRLGDNGPEGVDSVSVPLDPRYMVLWEIRN